MKRIGGVWCSHDILPLDETKRTTRVLVTGSRTWPAPGRVWDALGYYWELGGPLTVVHGDAPNGADRYAREWCERMNAEAWKVSETGKVVEHEPHPADWSTGDKGAGFARNVEMVDLGADVCLAYVDLCRKPTCRLRQRLPRHASHGAWQCSHYARDQGIEVVRYQTWEPT